MISRRTAIQGLLIVGGVFAGRLPAFARAKRGGPLYGLDLDNDRTIDLEEAKKAAASLFDKLDANHDGTLNKTELRGRLNGKEFTAADTDKDGTLTKDEYLALVEQRFKAADTDNDGTLTAKELQTSAGRKLLRLLK